MDRTKIIAPPPVQTMNEMHKHTGFIIAISITTVLLIASAVLAFLTWSNGESLKQQIGELNNSLHSVTTERDLAEISLKQAQEDLVNAPKPVPFFYTTTTGTPEDSLVTVLHKVTADSDTELFTTTSPRHEPASYNVYAIPRVGYDGRIWLNETSDVHNDNLILREFNTETGTELLPATFADDLPVKYATALSPDNTKIVAVYDTGNVARPDLAEHIVVWNIVTDAMTYIGTLSPGEYFANSDSKTKVQWVTNDCVETAVYSDVKSESSDEIVRKYADTRTFCM